MKEYKPRTKSWFINRIGKIIHREWYKCCQGCDHAYQNGLKVQNKLHAEYLAMIDSEFANDGIYISYSDKHK